MLIASQKTEIQDTCGRTIDLEIRPLEVGSGLGAVFLLSGFAHDSVVEWSGGLVYAPAETVTRKAMLSPAGGILGTGTARIPYCFVDNGGASTLQLELHGIRPENLEITYKGKTLQAQKN